MIIEKEIKAYQIVAFPQTLFVAKEESNMWLRLKEYSHVRPFMVFMAPLVGNYQESLIIEPHHNIRIILPINSQEPCTYINVNRELQLLKALYDQCDI